MIAQMQNTELLFLDIQVPIDKLLIFCRKAVKMTLFLGLHLKEDENSIVLSADNGEAELRFSLENEILTIDESYFSPLLDNRLFLIFEGLASVFAGTYVVVYKGESVSGCKVSIVDGVTTHCGERCLVRNVVFPTV